MGKIVFVIGDSGVGKSTSIRTLNPESTYIINVVGKDLPFRGSSNKYKVKSETEKGNMCITSDHNKIIKIIDGISASRPDIKTLIIDDFGYVLTHQMMGAALQKGFEKFVCFAKSVQDVLEAIQYSRNDLYVILTWHTEYTEDGKYKLKTAGKMIDNHVKPEGTAAIVLHALIRDQKYKFLTQNDGVHMAKSPLDMFPEKLIDNDLQFVIEKMNEYYNDQEESLEKL